MSWFQAFVTQVQDKYRELSKTEFKAASFEEKLDLILAERRQEVESSFIGEVGERFVEQVVAKQGYETIRSIGSRSPADVWGLGSLNDLAHIALLQVKTTRKGRTPAALSAEEEASLEKFCPLVYSLFYDSPAVPAELKGRPLVVSAGYAGVVFDFYGMETTDYDIRYVGASVSRAASGGPSAWWVPIAAFYEGLAPRPAA